MNAVTVIGVGLLVVTGQAPPPFPDPPPIASGSASIEGRVMDASSEKPIEGVEVRLSDFSLTTEKSATSRRTFIRASKTRTDRDGFFAFRDIAAGSYQLMAMDKRYFTSCFGATRQSPGPCVELQLVADQAKSGTDFYLRRAGLVTGRLVDHDGQPIAQVEVRATQTDLDRPYGMSGRSDADGRFEMGGLPAGAIFLVVEMFGTAGQGHYRAYYPGVLNRNEAQPIGIEPGATIDVEIRVPAITTASINAQVSGPPGFKLDQLTLVRPETRTLLSLNEPGAVMNLREGRYVIAARASLDEKSLAAFAMVDLHTNDLDVSLQLEPAGLVTGRVVAERGGLPPVSGVRVAAVWMGDGLELDPMGADEVSVGPDGAFRLDRMFGYRQFRVVGLPADWQVTAIRAGRSDITASGLDIVSASTTELTIVVARR